MDRGVRAQVPLPAVGTLSQTTEMIPEASNPEVLGVQSLSENDVSGLCAHILRGFGLP